VGELGGADNVGAVMLYPPFSDDEDDFEDDEEGLVDPIGFPGFIFATNPAKPIIARMEPYQNLFDKMEDLATAISRECPLSLRIFNPSSLPF